MPPSPGGAEPHGLGLVQHPIGRGIVEFGQADILGTNACLGIGAQEKGFVGVYT